jgi:hypothetical protein
MVRHRREFVASSMIGLMMLVPGCANESAKDRLVQVQGKVLVKGKPARYAYVTFVPVDEEKKEKFTARGRANEDGEFLLSTRRIDDGAIAGDYQVAISWRIPANPRDRNTRYGKELLPKKYQDPALSGVTAEIEPNQEELAAIDLNEVVERD